ncbi:hypothetical protein NC651_023645 [Populus alba x Populus x berolinensis]|nr:hypothetical protein NC651_023645 [Populus alba x Populus x berolinensis]
MEIKVHGIPMCTSTALVLLCLSEKVLEYELISNNLPFGQMLAFEDGDISSYERLMVAVPQPATRYQPAKSYISQAAPRAEAGWRVGPERDKETEPRTGAEKTGAEEKQNQRQQTKKPRNRRTKTLEHEQGNREPARKTKRNRGRTRGQRRSIQRNQIRALAGHPSRLCLLNQRASRVNKNGEEPENKKASPPADQFTHARNSAQPGHWLGPVTRLGWLGPAQPPHGLSWAQPKK